MLVAQALADDLDLVSGNERIRAIRYDVSLFDVTDDGLEVADVQAAGDRPVSVAVHGNLVYVLNQGADAIQALRITDEDTLVNIPRSTRPLSGTGVDAAQVAFSPDGGLLAVTEKATQTIDIYVVRPNGRAVGPNVQDSSGATPFGFQFSPDGRLYVSEAPASAVSSYDSGRRGHALRQWTARARST
jgi:6-phosphogluconolactonase (cycloisomerase 2 family)